MLEPSAKEEAMEIEGTGATAVKMKGYVWPLVSPDAFSGVMSWTDWIEHFDAVAVLNDWDDVAKLRWLPVRLSGKADTPLKLAAHSSAAHSKMNKINIPQAAAVVCAPLWIYPDTRYTTRAVLNAGPSEDVSVPMYMHMLIAIPTMLFYHTVWCFVLAYLSTTLGPWLRPMLAYQGDSTKTPRYQYTCMTETSPMTHLTYVSTRYGFGPSYFRTVATSLSSLPG